MRRRPLPPSPHLCVVLDGGLKLAQTPEAVCPLGDTGHIRGVQGDGGAEVRDAARQVTTRTPALRPAGRVCVGGGMQPGRSPHARRHCALQGGGWGDAARQVTACTLEYSIKVLHLMKLPDTMIP